MLLCVGVGVGVGVYVWGGDVCMYSYACVCLCLMRTHIHTCCRFLTAAACGVRDVDDDSEDQHFWEVGLLSNHAYSVLDVRLIPLDHRKALRLVTC